MELIVNKGQNIIRILFDDTVSCLVIKRPLAINWPDNKGSVGQYFSTSKFKSFERQKYTDEINHNLIFGTKEEILNSTIKFMDLFSNGKYKLSFQNLGLKNSKFLHNSTQDIFNGMCTPSFYFGNEENYFYTEPNENISQERVDYYYDLILSGIKPKVIIFQTEIENLYEESSVYILDGHHKIKAYQKAEIDICALRIIRIEDEPSKSSEIYGFAENLLLKEEYNHFFSNSFLGRSNLLPDQITTTRIDQYLISSSEIRREIIRYFIRLSKSKEKEKIEWLKQRVTNIYRNTNLKKGLSIASLSNSQYLKPIIHYTIQDVSYWQIATFNNVLK